MRRIDAFKLALAACAAVLFAFGIRTDSPAVRWGGIGCLVAAVALRFVGPRRPLD
ncbi:MAG: hypothetical protein ACR2KM_13235 [Gemmatimonadaceae bacterium]